MQIPESHFFKMKPIIFSISHCGDYAAVMVSSKQRVGVDIELVTGKVARVKNKFLSQTELDMLMAVENTAIESFYNAMLTAAWSIKESLYKWYGDGKIDFIRQLHINAIVLTGNSGFANCTVLKNNPVELVVPFLFFNGNCISRVVS